MLNSLFISLAAAAAMYFGFHKPDSAAVVNPAAEDTINLDAYKGKVLVLHYWASWSKASRAENKNLLRIYQLYRLNPNVVFAGVSLDTDAAAWKQAIAEDELTYKDHFCDFRKYASPMVKQFAVSTIPRFFVFDKNGRLVNSAANCHQMEQTINLLLKP